MCPRSISSWVAQPCPGQCACTAQVIQDHPGEGGPALSGGHCHCLQGTATSIAKLLNCNTDIPFMGPPPVRLNLTSQMTSSDVSSDVSDV
eukprot:362616-Chlamydomonas_euryale.AAC.4